MILVTGRIAREVLDNGGCNWDDEYKKMLTALSEYLRSGNTFSSAILEEISELVGYIYKKGYGDEEPNRLCEL